MKQWIVSLILSFLPLSLGANSLTIIGNIPVRIPIEETTKSGLKKEKFQIVYIQDVRLSANAQQVVGQRVQMIHDEALLELSMASPVKAVDLGMNKTPVLDQGRHGSCVTFSATAALDALSGKKNYISQLCSLELGSYLKKHRLTQHSGWNGSFGSVVLKQLQDYGLITLRFQKKQSCAGIKRYPVDDANNRGKAMSLSDYSANALPVSDWASWASLLDVNEAFSQNHNPEKVLRAVKKSLDKGHRLIFGTLLDLKLPHAGALGQYKKPFDSWVLTPEISNHAKQGKIKGGHEMVIIGYNNQGIIRDSEGRISIGVLILRNSWGKNAGDKGNYYMSYAYFKALTDEVQVIKPVE